MKIITARQIFKEWSEIKKALCSELWSNEVYWNVGDRTTFDAIKKYIENQGTRMGKDHRSKLKNLILNKFLIYRAQCEHSQLIAVGICH
jgi:hypothetical protein